MSKTGLGNGLARGSHNSGTAKADKYTSSPCFTPTLYTKANNIYTLNVFFSQLAISVLVLVWWSHRIAGCRCLEYVGLETSLWVEQALTY